MATLASGNTASPARKTLSSAGAAIGQAWRSLGPLGRRATLTGIGAVFALSFGVATAGAIRLPADMKTGAADPDEMTVKDELPAEAAARDYALQNPPTYAVAPTLDAQTDVKGTDADTDVDLLKADQSVDAVTYTSSAPNPAEREAAAPAQTSSNDQT